MPTLRAGIGPVLLVAITACGPATGLIREPDTAIGVARGCAPETAPAPLPAITALVDTSALFPALRELEPAEGSVLLTMWYDTQGANERRAVIRHTAGVAVADSVQQLVFAALREVPESADPWGARLQLVLAPEIDHRITHREYCPPRPLDSQMEAAIDQMPFASSVNTVIMEATIHPVGYVERAEVVRGAARGSEMERRLFDHLRQYAFDPARIDGYPVRGTIRVPIRVR